MKRGGSESAVGPLYIVQSQLRRRDDPLSQADSAVATRIETPRSRSDQISSSSPERRDTV